MCIGMRRWEDRRYIEMRKSAEGNIGKLYEDRRRETECLKVE